MFKFTIRELLLLALVVCLAVGWWADHRRLQKSANQARFTLYMLWEAVSEAHDDVDVGGELIDDQLEQFEEPIVTTGRGMKLVKIN